MRDGNATHTTTGPANGSGRAAAREAMRERILDAALTLLARDGFAGFGVNAVAREAGCDKVLIYRYFNGFDGLLDSLGARLDIWLGPEDSDGVSGHYGSVMRSVLQDYLRALRANNLVKQILAWELVQDDDATRRIGKAKGDAIGRWFQGVRQRSGPPPAGSDAAVLNAVLIAAAHHLALRENSSGDFMGLDLRDPNCWARIEAVFNTIITGAYGAPDGTEDPP
ncbi:TetR/AcrR family transcriptional regulator [Azospirillum griseum]|uniref:TetR/AcrR family transcriptional regulator n=1 Tax=Azospirillum griseum TaxID=2496639 RepID=A0A431VDJ6_9PROT|nr:TetR/AcrR family transcriptional regulator [Azospirillum griseum]RTR17084.1 TetR/AcrR family transcriptional regulator [Azospirillum griseum]